MISKRSRNIILEIFKKGSIRISDLSVMFKVTERTVRSDLDEIDYFLESNGFEPLLHDGKKGISFSSANLKTSLIYKLINQKDVVTASFTKTERRLEILYFLAMHPQAVKIEELAEHLLVSKSTIVKDLEYLKEYLAQEDFHIHGSLDGIRLTGDEFALRSTLVKIFMESMDKQTILDLIRLIGGDDKLITYKEHWRLFEGLDLKEVLHISEILRGVLSIHLSDSQYLQIIGNLCMMLKRCEIGCSMTEKSILYASRMSDFAVEKIYDLLKKTQQLPEEEKTYLQYIVYLCCHELYIFDRRVAYEDCQQQAAHIVSYMKHNLELENENQTCQDVCDEIQAMRIEDELRIPEVKNIIGLQNEQYQEVFAWVKTCGIELTFQHRHMKDDDWWRIAVPFIAGRKQCCERKKVLIVSDKSKSLIAMLIRKLQLMFDIEIVGISGYANMETYIHLFPIDCIISTMKIASTVDMVQVHPLLSDENIQQLKQHLHTHLVPAQSGCENHNFVSYVIEEKEETGIEAVLRHMDELLAEKKYTSVPLDIIIHMNMQKQQRDYTIQKGNLILNVRNHEVIKGNAVVHAKLHIPIAIDEHLVNCITLIVSTSVQEYLLYMETYL